MQTSSTLVEYLVAAERIVVFTGAGISTGAGIPDYRGPQGIWKTRPEIPLDVFLESFEKQREYWQQKSEDFMRWGKVDPTPAHLALAKLGELGKLRAVISQNIDGLHRRSGIREDLLVELHGRMDQVVCVECGFRDAAESYYREFLEAGEVPDCKLCGHVLKPGVIQFGENLVQEDLWRAQAAIQDVDLVIAVGSTLAVQPAATFPIMAARMGVPYVIVNQGETAHDGMPHVSLRLEGDVQEILPAAVADTESMFG
ncbi:MAG: Sir2 family NAD-dependent protein deacetylase [Verrucomicrobia bacterium]|nr:Sir2 family NAD-dependent protein deacetylase [Verrucomicrobiota bacterium]MCH8511715.1 Sir2 family NAD-dependent protein deacetylase [Kiritimatiellia bacterium]